MFKARDRFGIERAVYQCGPDVHEQPNQGQTILQAFCDLQRRRIALQCQRDVSAVCKQDSFKREGLASAVVITLKRCRLHCLRRRREATFRVTQYIVQLCQRQVGVDNLGCEQSPR
ncbi:hypothetical protein IP84_02890 [beta proteobacterium AAP99]|nr:hypothetical protein IP84_02890 [beta proteobacterium AAP99]